MFKLRKRNQAVVSILVTLLMMFSFVNTIAWADESLSNDDQQVVDQDSDTSASSSSGPMLLMSSTLPLPDPIQVAGSATDSTITMSANNTAVSTDDNTWEISLTNGTLNSTAGADITSVLTINGLPNDLTWTAVNGGSNNIIITVSGTTITAITAWTEVSVTIMGKAVSESEAADSESLAVYLEPASTPLLMGAMLKSSPSDFTYSLSGSEATITGYTGTDQDVEIPEVISDGGTDYPVTALDISVFYGKSITSITIPTGVTSIPLNEFATCTCLGTVIFTGPSSLASIDLAAFNGCTSLGEINIPSTVTSIGNKAFYNCSSLSKVYSWGAMPTFGTQVFDGTTSDFTIYYHISHAASWAGYTDYNAKAFCTLTLDLNDGSSANSSYVDVDNSGHITAPTDPTSSKGSFAGWYKDAACTDDFDFTNDTVSDDITLYAKWNSGGKVEGTVIDSSVTMASGNTVVNSSDNEWEIDVTTGTVKGSSGDDLTPDLTLTGLPTGLSWTAQNAGANKIQIIVSGTASPALSSKASVSVIIKCSAVTDVGASDSDAMILYVHRSGHYPIALAVNQNTNTIYVANKGSLDVTVMDGATDTVKATVPAGTYPRCIAVNPDAKKTYITNQQDKTVTVINGASNNVITTLPSGTYPVDLAVNRSTDKVYVANNSSKNVTVIDGAADNIAGTVAAGNSPYDVAVNQNTNRIYTVNYYDKSISVIDGSSDTVTATVTSDTGPYAVALNPNPTINKIYVANLKDFLHGETGTVTVIDGATNATSSITVGKKPCAITINLSTNNVYVANLFDDTVTVIDGTTDTVIATVAVGDGPLAMGIDQTTNKIYVANCGDNTVTIIDGVTNSTNTVAAGDYPCAVAVNEVTHKAYIANQYSDDITVISSLPPAPLKVAGTASDSSVTMASDNKAVSSSDNTWDIGLTSGTLKGVSGTDLTADISLSGLPAALTYTATNGGSNDILITVAGSADTALTADATVTAVIKGSAVTEVGSLDSEGTALTLLYVPPAAEPTITLTTARTAGSNICLSIEADPADLPGVWIDLNGNNTEDPGEEVIGLYKNYTVSSLTIVIHGKVNKLNCQSSQLTSLNLSNTTYLVNLNCNSNQIDSLDVSRNTALQSLTCKNNLIASLDLSQNTMLNKLDAYNNKLAALDLSKNTLLTYLNCQNNQLPSLNVSKNTLLTYLNCSGNQITTLDLTLNTQITTLHCALNQLTALDVTHCPGMTWLTCSNNVIGALDLSRNTALTDLYCNNNQLATLDLTGNTLLKKIDCYNNQLTTINVPQDTVLYWLDCSNNRLPSLDISKNTAFTVLKVYGNNINGAEMMGLVTGLPGRAADDHAKIYIIDTKAVPADGNVALMSDVAISTGKNWTVYDWNGGNEVLYAGSDPISNPINAATFDDSVTMASGNTMVSNDNTWEIDLTTGTLASTFSASDLTITGLPAVLTWAAQNGGNNHIVITVSGTAAAEIISKTTVSVVVKGSAVSDTGATDSDAINVYIYPAQTPAAPTIDPNGGSYTSSVQVTITGSGGTIYYTTDGTDPANSSSSTAYSGGFTVGKSEIIKAVIQGETRWSEMTSAEFTINTNSGGGGGGGGGGSSITSPSVVTDAATSITNASAVLNGEISSRGGGGITSYGFSYSSDEKQWTQVQAGSDNRLGTFTYTLSGLQPNTAYYFKAYATNGASTSYGEVKSLLVYQGQNPQGPQDGQQIVLRFYIDKTDYYVNDQLKSMDAAPLILGNRTLLPIRYVAEPLGYTVNWDENTQKVTITFNGKTIELVIGDNNATLNGERVPIDPDNPEVTPILVDPGRTMIPLRFVMEQLGCQVEWDPSTQKVKISYPK
ncbi:MAG TPA: stalk domain-containing protein [Syntrophomonadaceae bacterium]|nr:stalk domain-containing protein [Syntrophomonadaceae bacterium]